ncbi:MAG TPA: DUF4974 domain-containing protein [Sediminibacterium sp.]|jgi:hypothetical protein|uniref:FecR family protein n=1 Tax=Sediminibacterium sp. TaxID=1917865 RepID=UPI000BD85DBB|nr:FecR family protein [Sediminibacterium sp.]OZA67289.1 MAG: hypothetical protein B7X72_03930 [Sphingobacteriia bacterium 39-39-8]HQS25352.1 DUF4974 domain-containing protein [Sediminibacterium sp.]HQS36321.1 DUF4974 domain-containing protein [Sediminibacterium sp.]
MEVVNNRLRYLFEKYYDKSCTSEEVAELFDIVQNGEYDNMLLEFIAEFGEKNNDTKDIISQQDAQQMLSFILAKKSRPKVIPIRKFVVLKKYFAAAAIIVIMLTGYWLWSKNETDFSNENLNKTSKVDFNPGKEGAILTLANGEQLVLDSSKNGTLALQGNTSIVKRDGQIIYNGEAVDNEILQNKLSTPKGKQYNIILADGTKVWLNAASSITYPTVFNANERKISVTGEVYLEVAHNPEKPFKVSINSPSGDEGIIEVLGTRFNINTYMDENASKTTLLQGKIKLVTKSNNTILSPGQQVQIGVKGKISTIDGVDLEEIIAWKNGFFEFNGEDIASVMRQISRWYDVEVIYEGKIPKKEFGGKMGRDLKLSQVLKILDKYGVHFRIKDGMIIVSQ